MYGIVFPEQIRTLHGGKVKKSLTYYKGVDPRQKGLNQNERYHFEYEEGQESKVVGTMIEMAQDRNLNFSWNDADILSRLIGFRIAHRLKNPI
jgi:hypothetical protein